MKILIYGLSGYREIIEKSLKEDIEVLYTDSFSEIKSFNNKKFIKFRDINKTKFDVLIIAINNIDIANDVKRKLVDEGLSNNKIVIFEEVFKRIYGQKVDQVLVNQKSPLGIVLGISHGVCGIDTNFLGGYVNLSCRSQDIFYNFAVFNYYIDKLKEKSNIKNIILEMYDYNYFNYDVSLISNAVNFYYSKGGFNKCAHNFEENIHYDISFEKMKEKEYLNEIDMETNNLIDNIFYKSKWIKAGYSGYDTIYTQSIHKNVALPVRKFISGLVRKKYSETINENIKLFKSFCTYIKRNFPSVKLTAVLIPRFYTMEYALSPLLIEWKREFYEIINSSEIDDFIDYKNLIEISGNEHFYNDVNHLNNIGALAFTEILKSDLKLN